MEEENNKDQLVEQGTLLGQRTEHQQVGYYISLELKNYHNYDNENRAAYCKIRHVVTFTPRFKSGFIVRLDYGKNLLQANIIVIN